MSFKGNKGEWSELYAFFKLLADGRLYSGDGHLNRDNDRFYPILEIFRNDAPDRNSYKVNAAKKQILIAGKTCNIEISQSEFENEAKVLLSRIKQMSGSMELSYIEAFMRKIDAKTVKASSADKADIRIVIHNFNNGTKPELGYSIKSKLGADSTLINSNKDGTNFIYKVSGISDRDVITFNNMTRFKKKFEFLSSLGADVSFLQCASKVLHNNLSMLDLGIEKIIGESLLQYYKGNGRILSEITDRVSKIDPLSISDHTDQPMYEYKVKQLLLAFALGMTSTKPWHGKFNANGGYIVVKEDGEIVCYHFFDRNELEDYLYLNTRYETPSTSRHHFGMIYKENGNLYLKLNLQVRFIG